MTMKGLIASCAGLLAATSFLLAPAGSVARHNRITAAAHAVEFKGRYKLSGATSKHGSFVASDRLRHSCSEVGQHGTATAQGGKDLFDLPGPPSSRKKTEKISFIGAVSYNGPGTFSKKDFRQSGPEVIVGTTYYNLLAKKASMSMTVKANGSGVFTFSKARSLKGKTLSGKLSWQCT